MYLIKLVFRRKIYQLKNTSLKGEVDTQKLRAHPFTRILHA